MTTRANNPLGTPWDWIADTLLAIGLMCALVAFFLLAGALFNSPEHADAYQPTTTTNGEQNK